MSGLLTGGDEGRPWAFVAPIVDSVGGRGFRCDRRGVGSGVAAVTGAVTAAMLNDRSGIVYLWFPVAAAVSAALALYHCLRWALLRGG